MQEAKKINSSLSALGNVINALTSNKPDFVPYRDSKLTRVLKDSLGGNFKTTLIVTCYTHLMNVDETISTLNFAKRAKKVNNIVKPNIKRNPEDLEKIILNMIDEISKLKKDNSTLWFQYNQSSRNSNESNFEKEIIRIDSLESTLKERDNQIESLREEIEKLNNEKDYLIVELEKSKNEIKLGETIEILEKSIKSNVKEIENVYKSFKEQIEIFYREENLILKEKLNNYEDNFLSEFKKMLSNEFDFVN